MSVSVGLGTEESYYGADEEKEVVGKKLKTPFYIEDAIGASSAAFAAAFANRCFWGGVQPRN